MLFVNPVAGVIHPLSWPRPAGNHAPKVTQWFGCTGFVREPALGTCEHFHRGLDISTRSCGPAILAAAAGRVAASFIDTNGEKIVAIRHPHGWATGYGHLDHREVHKGDVVAAGQVIGTLGMSGNATACHLHWWVKSDLEPADNVFGDLTGRWRNPWSHLEQNT